MSCPIRVGVVGASGLVGKTILARLATAATIDACVVAMRHVAAVEPLSPTRPGEAVDRWRDANSAATAAIEEQLAGLDVVVIAAGAAAPDSTDAALLAGANTLLPWVVLDCARRAGATRVVHVSSAAVEGSTALLHERLDGAPFSPYSRSKMDGELGLVTLAREHSDGPELAIYRPTTVVHPARPVSHTMVRAASRRWLPLGPGSVPLPLAHPSNMAAVVEHLTLCDAPPLVTVHPSESMDLARLRVATGASPAVIATSATVFRLVCAVGVALATISRRPGLRRRVELIRDGQATGPTAVEADGYAHPYGAAAWRDLADQVLGRTGTTTEPDTARG